MKYRCIRECLVQSRKHGINQPFKPGQVLEVGIDLQAELPSIAPFWELVPEAVPEKPEVINLWRMTKDDLIGVAEAKGLAPESDMTRKELITLIEAG